jgi:ankyrin repeat protein
MSNVGRIFASAGMRLLVLALPCGALGAMWYVGDVRSKTGSGDATPLHAAARHGDCAAIDRICRRNPAAVNEAEPHTGVMPLMYAARYGRRDAAEALLAQRAAINLAAPGCGTALAIAVERGDVPMTRLLLARHADPNAVSPADRHTPLMFAVRSDDPTILKLLLDAGADPTAKDVAGNTALSEALAHENQSAALRLSEVTLARR